MFNLNDFPSQPLIDALYSIDKEYPWHKDNFYSCLKKEVLQKNIWLFNELSKVDKAVKTVNFYAAGFFFYESFLFKKYDDIILYDYDPSVQSVNWKLLNDFNKIDQRMLDVVLDKEWVRHDADLLINTSCELMYDMKFCTTGYDAGTLMAFQGTNEKKRGNINIHDTIYDFIKTLPPMEVIYSGTADINHKNIYMVIGKKL